MSSNSLKIFTNILKPLETSSSIGMFARDTGGCLISRLGLSRSKDESKEISFVELSESAVFYFGAPLISKASSKVYSRLLNVDNNKFVLPFKDLKNLDNKTIQKIKLGKFSRIFTTFGLILPFIFAIGPLRNILTYSQTGKEKFTKVVGLEKNEKDEKHKQESKQKVTNLLKKMSLISLAAVSFGLAIMSSYNNPKIYKKIEPLVNFVTKHLDFTSTSDLTLAHYGALIYPVSIAGYFYASRDKYEKMENARRFSITVPLLFFGEKLIQNPIYRFFDKKFNTKVYENKNIKSYNEIMKMPSSKRDKFLKTKNFAYALTFLINTMAIAGAVSLLNRFETRRQFNKDNKNLTDSNSKGVI